MQDALPFTHQQCKCTVSLSGLMDIFPGGYGLAGTRMSPLWIYWS